jgi:hypothetical protein
MQFLIASCTIPEIKSISCQNTSIIAQFQDGSQVSTPMNALGKKDFIWLKDENKVEIKVAGSFDSNGKYMESTQTVPALLKKNHLSFKTNPSTIFPGTSYTIDMASKTYSSVDLVWQTSPDGPFRMVAKGSCNI